MTQTKLDTKTTSRTRPSLVVALLAPMFLGVSGGDVSYARMAAIETIETINDYRARNNADLIAVAQIVAFGLAALGSLSLSLVDELSISMALRLRGNANACNGSAEENRRALRQSHITPDAEPFATIPHDDIQPEPDLPLSITAEQQLEAESLARLQPGEPAEAPSKSQKKRHQEMWAIAMVSEVSEPNASTPNLPPAERNAAPDLLYGTPAQQPEHPIPPIDPSEKHS